MGTRLDLQKILTEIPGVNKAYYQSPGPEKMVYPCIVYKKDFTSKRHANNNPYMIEYRYMLTVMDKDPDSPIFEAVERLPKCTFNRHYESDQLHHQVFELYF